MYFKSHTAIAYNGSGGFASWNKKNAKTNIGDTVTVWCIPKLKKIEWTKKMSFKCPGAYW